MPTPEIIFNIIPPTDGKNALIFVCLMCVSLGAVTCDVVSHLRYDYLLIRKPGWSQPSKVLSRTAYLMCRYVPPFSVTVSLMFPLLKYQNCRVMGEWVKILGILSFDPVVLVFVLRTMALYSWKRAVVVPLTVCYIVVVIISIICVPFWGRGFDLPGTDFCGFDTQRHVTPTIVSHILYKVTSMIFDLVLLLLTLHRLLEGGLSSVWRGKSQRSGLNGQGISSYLISQGLHFYVLQLACDVFLLAAWFGFRDVTLQRLPAAFSCSIPPIAATHAFRNIGIRASSRSSKGSQHINEIMDSEDELSGGHTTPGTRRSIAPLAAGKVAAELESPTLQEGQATAYPERTSRITWGGEKHHLAQPQDDASESKGIFVTVGPVSRVDEARTPRYSSDSDEQGNIELRQQLPTLSAKDEKADQFDDSSSTEKIV